MEIRKYLLTVHTDGTLTAVEYDEPSDYPRQFWPRSEKLMKSAYNMAYNMALDDVRRVLDVEIAHCQRKEWDCRLDADECARWVSKASECVVLKTAVSKLYTK